MNNAILIQQCWDGDVGGIGDYKPLMELTIARNEAYCLKHGFDFIHHVGTIDPKYSDVRQGGWVKIELMIEACRKGYQYIVWMDPDALIRDTDTDLRLGCPDGIGACWMRVQQPEGRYDHWNVGALYLQNSERVRKFLDAWLAEFPGEPKWMEQGVFNKLAMQSNVVHTISDRWNSTLNYSMVPDAVVLGYHGNGNANARLEMMRGTLAQLEAK